MLKTATPNEGNGKEGLEKAKERVRVSPLFPSLPLSSPLLCSLLLFPLVCDTLVLPHPTLSVSPLFFLSVALTDLTVAQAKLSSRF